MEDIHPHLQSQAVVVQYYQTVVVNQLHQEVAAVVAREQHPTQE
jgi:hypothetical protein